MDAFTNDTNEYVIAGGFIYAPWGTRPLNGDRVLVDHLNNQLASLRSIENKLSDAEEALARMRAFANPARPDLFSLQIGNNFMSPFSSEEKARTAAVVAYRRSDAIIHNNGPRELTCCEETVAALLTGRESF